MKIYFYVNGAPVETYTCAAPPYSHEDEVAIELIKQSVFRNFGYPPIIVVDREA